MLELTSDLPSDEEILRWLGEPVRSLVISTSIFITNKKGFPVLSRPHQVVLKAFAGINVQVIIRGTLRHECIKYYVQYINHIWQVTNNYFRKFISCLISLLELKLCATLRL